MWIPPPQHSVLWQHQTHLGGMWNNFSVSTAYIRNYRNRPSRFMAVINVHRHETNVWAQFAMATARLDTFVETAKQNILRADPTADIVVLGPTRIQQALHLDDAQKFRDLQAHIGRLSGVIEKLSSRLYL